MENDRGWKGQKDRACELRRQGSESLLESAGIQEEDRRTAEPCWVGGMWVQIPPLAPLGPDGSVAVPIALCDKRSWSVKGPLAVSGKVS